MVTKDSCSKVTPLFNLSYRTYYDYEQDKFVHPVQQPQLNNLLNGYVITSSENILHPDWAVLKDEAGKVC